MIQITQICKNGIKLCAYQHVDEVVSKGMGVEKFVMMTWLAPLENCSQLIKGVDK